MLYLRLSHRAAEARFLICRLHSSRLEWREWRRVGQAVPRISAWRLQWRRVAAALRLHLYGVRCSCARGDPLAVSFVLLDDVPATCHGSTTPFCS
jgi:hypothetical protein